MRYNLSVSAARSAFFVVACLTTAAFGQPPATLRLKPGENIRTTSWRDSVYRFSSYQEGQVIFISGPSPKYKMNYNVLSGDMEFISPKGDTMVLKKTPEVKLVMVGGHVFFLEPAQGYIEILIQQQLALGVQKEFVIARKDVEVSNGYSTSSNNTGAVVAYRGNSRSVTSNADLLVRINNTYFFIDQKNEAHPATKASLMKLFPDDRDKLKTYLKEQHTDFKQKDDLARLLAFCNGLAPGK
ncbi:hypothetical protein [Chryseolinea soli]|uniref:FecR protein domain-containing protein n=1 Tax=Chryseolinea soli TaxID=2321403 RepID=A0A385SJP5_9BACT|nr:hypothetical protein [Chryseolinea soli]AYB30145.1 hypothetical protein D4L85_05915 [Chryseolinea soli]